MWMTILETALGLAIKSAQSALEKDDGGELDDRLREVTLTLLREHQEAVDRIVARLRGGSER